MLNFKENNVKNLLEESINLIRSNELNKAKLILQKVMLIESHNKTANLNFGAILVLQKQYEESQIFFKKVLKIDENNFIANFNLGIAYLKSLSIKEASKFLEKANYLKPNNSDVLHQLGDLNLKTSNVNEAEYYYKKVNKMLPKNITILNQLNIIFQIKKDYKKSVIFLKEALNLQKDNFFLVYALGLLQLMMGDYKKGLKNFECRKKITKININLTKNQLNKEWSGEKLNGKKILIIFEQGIGDQINFARYIFSIQKKYSAKIILLLKKNLHYLFKDFDFDIIDLESPIPKHDFYQYLLSLPLITYDRQNIFLENKKFITTKNLKKPNIINKIKEIKGIKIAFNWRGNSNYQFDQFRSIPLKHFKKIFDIDKFSYISMQKNDFKELNAFRDYKNIYDFTPDLDNNNKLFYDTIQVLKEVDLLITADTALVHFASTLNIKTYLLLSHYHDWRWNIQIKNGTLYQNLKIIKQSKINNWDDVFENLFNKLNKINF